MNKFSLILIGGILGSIAGLILGWCLGLLGESLPRISNGMEYENVMSYMIILALVGSVLGPLLAIRWNGRKIS